MIYTIPKILSEDTCSELIAYFENHPELLRKSEDIAQQLFNAKDIEPYTIKDQQLLREMEVLRTKMTVEISKYYHTTVYLDYWDLVKWYPGDWMKMHADNVDEHRKPFDYCGWRTHSAIVYLNQDFSGGETVFRDVNQNVFPETGKALIFPAGYDYTHGVNEVTEGSRYTIALWFTEDPKHVMLR